MIASTRGGRTSASRSDLIRQSDSGSSGGSTGESNGGADGDLVSDIGGEIKVTLDRWSIGQLGVGDLIAAAAVLLVGFAVAWLVHRLVRRSSGQLAGAAKTGAETIGKLLSASVCLVALAFSLEILGFSLGPILMLLLVIIVAVLLLRPLITNLSDGLLLQLRGALETGDLVETSGGALGIVREITTRTTVIATDDGRLVYVPNSDVLNDAIVNYTATGRLRATFEVMVGCDEDLELVVPTMRLALAQVDVIRSEPPPDVRVVRVVGRLVVLRALVWHAPSFESRREALDEGIRAVLADLAEAGVSLDGPTLAELQSDVSASPSSGLADSG